MAVTLLKPEGTLVSPKELSPQAKTIPSPRQCQGETNIWPSCDGDHVTQARRHIRLAGTIVTPGDHRVPFCSRAKLQEAPAAIATTLLRPPGTLVSP